MLAHRANRTCQCDGQSHARHGASQRPSGPLLLTPPPHAPGLPTTAAGPAAGARPAPAPAPLAPADGRRRQPPSPMRASEMSAEVVLQPGLWAVAALGRLDGHCSAERTPGTYGSL